MTIHSALPSCGSMPPAIILGTNEIASAIAVHLQRGGYRVVLSHDPHLPVIRRAMAFHDVLWGVAVALDGVRGVAVERAIDIFRLAGDCGIVGVTGLGLVDLLPMGPFSLLVDARMNKRATVPDLRHLAEVTVGVGPGFGVGLNCDVAVETRPDRTGELVTEGATLAQGPQASRLGDLGAERFVRAEIAGCWRTSLDIGMRVYRGMILGHLDRHPVTAPLDGVLRGLARDDAEIPAGAKIVEIDGRGRFQAKWTGIDQRGRAIAVATLRAALVAARAEGVAH